MDTPTEIPDFRKKFGFTDSTYSYAEFKNDVGNTLIRKFGKDGVTRGSKAFDVHANNYRVDADCVATFEHRRYTGNYNTDGTLEYISGTEIRPDKGGRIVNWPHQHYENGVAKNKNTNNRYKFITRGRDSILTVLYVKPINPKSWPIISVSGY